MSVHHIADAPQYHANLRKALRDKLWFVGLIPTSRPVTYIDFGCADGALLGAIQRDNPNAEIVGYDIRQDAIEQAISRLPGGYWTPNIEMLGVKAQEAKRQGRRTVLILSSVVHEVLSQGTMWWQFWQTVRSLSCDYIAIRDMAVEAETSKLPPSYREAEALCCAAEYQQWMLKGDGMENRKDMLHGLLKYRYTEGWEREFNENYFPLSAEEYLNLCSVGSGYQLRHFEHYSYAHHRERWFTDFGITVNDPTHIKLLLKRIP